jgi:hypothetical protein
MTDSECRNFRQSLMSIPIKDLKKQRDKTRSKIRYHKSQQRVCLELDAQLLIISDDILRRNHDQPAMQWSDPLPLYIRISPTVLSTLMAPVTEDLPMTRILPTTLTEISEGVVLPLELCTSLTKIYSEFELLVMEFERLQLEPHQDDAEVSTLFAQRNMHVNHLRKKNPSLMVYAEILDHDLSMEMMNISRTLRELQEERNLTKQRILQDSLTNDLLLVDQLESLKLLVPPCFIDQVPQTNNELQLIDKNQLDDYFNHFPMQVHEYRRSVDVVELTAVIDKVIFHLEHIEKRRQWAIDIKCNGKESFDELLQCCIDDQYPLEQVMYRQFCLCRLCVVDLPELKGKLMLPLPPLPKLSSLPAKRTSFWSDHSTNNFQVEVAEEFYNDFEGGTSDTQVGEIVTREIVPNNDLLSIFSENVSRSCIFFNRHDVFYPRGLDPKTVDVEIWIRFLFTYSKTPPTSSDNPHVNYIRMNHDHTKLYIHMAPGPIDNDETWIIITSSEMLLKSSWSTWRELQLDGILIKPEKFFHVPLSDGFIDASLDEIEAAEKLEVTMERQAIFRKTTVEDIARRTITEKRRVVEMINGREITHEATIKTVHQITYRVENRLCRRRREFQTWQSKWKEAYKIFLKDKELSTSGVNGLKKHIQTGLVHDEDKKRESQAKNLPFIISSGPVKSQREKDKAKLIKEMRSMNLDFRKNITNCERELRLARLVELKDEVIKFLAWTHDEVHTIALHAIHGNDWKTLSELAVMSDATISEMGTIQVFPGPLGRITAPKSWTRHCDPLLIPQIKQKQSNESVFEHLYDPDISAGIGIRRATRKLKDARKQARDVEKQLRHVFQKIYCEN